MKVLLFIGFLGLLVLTTTGQNPDEISTLESDLPDASGTQRMEILATLADYYSDTLSELATGYAAQYLKLAELYGSVQDQANAYLIFGTIYKYQLEYEKALQSNLKAIELNRLLGDSLMIAVNQYRAGNNLLFMHRLDSALKYTTLALNYYKQIADTFKIFSAKIQLGKILTVDCKGKEAQAYFKKLITEILDSKLKNKRNFLAWANYWLSQSEMQTGDFRDAAKHLQKSIVHYEQINQMHSMIGSMQKLGELYLMTGDYALAYELFFDSYKKAGYVKGTTGQMNFIAQHHLNMGEVYANIRKYNDALLLFDSTLNMADRHGLVNLKAKAYRAIGKIKFKQGKYDEALGYFEKTLAIQQQRRSKYNRARVLNNIAGVYQLQGKYNQALDIYHHALEINKNIENRFGSAQNLKNIATCYMNLKNYPKVEAALNTGIQMALITDVKNLILKYYRNFISLCKHTGQHDSAHQYFDKYLSLSGDMTENDNRNMTELLLRIHTDEMNAKTQLLQQRLNIRELQNEKQEMQIRQILAVSGLIVTLLVLILFLYFNKIRTARKLERVVQERTKSLKENEQKLIEINQTRERFYSIIAHDLKSPFNSLIGFSNLLSEDFEEFSDQERKKYISIIRNSAEEIFILLENLLDWTRSSTDNIRFKQVRLDLSQLTRQALMLQEKNAAIKNITINNEVPKNTYVFADENMIRTVIRNLLSNAIKFTDKGGQVTIEAQQSDSMVEFSVEDTGVGIPPEYQKKLFSLDAKVRKKGTANERGTGLGLLLCKDFVEKNNGKIHLDSKPGEGSKFTIILPVKKNSHEE